MKILNPKLEILTISIWYNDNNTMTQLRKKSFSAKDYSSLLKGFLFGKVTLAELRDKIDDRVYELRNQGPELTEEEMFLAPIELLILDIDDGFRPLSELDDYIKNLVAERPVQAQKVR